MVKEGEGQEEEGSRVWGVAQLWGVAVYRGLRFSQRVAGKGPRAI